jgi:UDP-glucose 4-epimerase
MNNILITGSSGYIGSHLLKKINNSFLTDVCGLDKENPDKVYPDKFYYGDIRNDKYLKYKDPFECVIHLAAEMRVGESVKDPILYYETNVLGTLNVLKNIKTKHFIFASTGAAEGLASPYGLSKKAAEEIVIQYCTENNIDYTIFRFYNVIGSDGISIKNPDGLFYNLLKSKDTGVFTIFGNDYDTEDGTCMRDYVHVNEICESIISAVEKPANQIENLGHGRGASVLEMFNIFRKVNNLNVSLQYGPRRKGDIPISVLKNKSSYIKDIYSIEDLLTL